MEMTNLYPRPLDEKNLTTDWIEEIFGEEWLRTPKCKGTLSQYIFYIEDVLVEVSWQNTHNHLSFRVIHDVIACDDYLQKMEDKVKKAIKERMEKFERNMEEYTDDFAIRLNESKTRMDFFFYYKHD